MQSHTNTVMRHAYSLDEAAESLGISRRTMYELMARDQLRTITLGRRRLVPAQELERLVTPQEGTA